jgi:uncharacterized protein (TIGR02246 family)
MSRKYGLVVLVLAGGLVALAGFRDRSVGQDNAAPPAVPAPPVAPAVAVAAQPPAKAEGAEAGIKAITAEYVKAFNAGDAKTAAALWTTEGEYIGDDGETHKGRAEIEKGLAAFLKANPKATVEIQVENARVLGRGIASAEGLVRVTVPGADTPDESRYSALHVLEDGKWHAASVRELALDPATDITVKAMDWIIGEWTAKGDTGEVKLTYKWDENKVFISGFYEITKDGKRLSGGTQVIGRNPGGGLRSWTFDNSGTTNHGIWVKDGSRWLNEVTGLLTDGSEITSLNIIVPLSPDSFTWQTTDRAAAGLPLPALPPLKVTRVKK